jgi:transcriptional regulator with XRE-family HTH domain
LTTIAAGKPLTVPNNYDLHLVGLRTRRGWTQEQLARAIGAASKAVIYQWESRRRKPSAALSVRIQALPSREAGNQLAQQVTTSGAAAPNP